MGVNGLTVASVRESHEWKNHWCVDVFCCHCFCILFYFIFCSCLFVSVVLFLFSFCFGVCVCVFWGRKGVVGADVHRTNCLKNTLSVIQMETLMKNHILMTHHSCLKAPVLWTLHTAGGTLLWRPPQMRWGWGALTWKYKGTDLTRRKPCLIRRNACLKRGVIFHQGFCCNFLLSVTLI